MGPQNWVGKAIGGRYQIEALLGQGGMSAVYRAYDPNLRRTVAIKLIHPHLSTDPNFVGRFKEEAAAVARLRHPHIVQVHDFNIDGDTYYMVMEHLVGETLQTRLRRLNTTGRHMSFVESIRISAQISDAAGYAHEHEIIHRDIKPANIMLDVHNQAILMDFGIVKIIGGEYHTSTGATIGTAMYMSPEQIRGERADDRSDIYSLGVTMYEMISGHPPFEADSAITLMMMVLNDPLPNLRILRDAVPEELLKIIYTALERDKSKRFQTMAELNGALNALQDIEQVPPEKTVAQSKLEPASLAKETEPKATSVISDVAETLKTDAPPKIPSEENILVKNAIAFVEDAPVITDKEKHNTLSTVKSPTSARSLSKSRLGKVIKRFYIPILSSILIIAIIIFAYRYYVASKPPSILLAPVTSAHIPINTTTVKNIVSLGIWNTDSYVTALAFSPDGTTLATANNRDWLRLTQYKYYAALWQIDQAQLQTYLMGNNQWIGDVTFSPDGKLVATASEDASISLWQAQSGSLERKIETYYGGVTGIDFSPDNQLLLASSWDGTVGLWQVSNGNLLRTMQKQDYGFRDVVFSPDGYFFAAGMDLGNILVWKINDVNPLLTLEGHTGAVTRLAYSPDGSQLASASEDHSIRLWNLNDGSSQVLLGHSGTVHDLTFSNDGSLLSSVSDDGTIRNWQVSDGQQLVMLSEEEAVLSVAFSPDGVYLVAGEANGVIHFWGISEVIPLEPNLTPTAP
jgi:serine/threonine protein kinase